MTHNSAGSKGEVQVLVKGHASSDGVRGDLNDVVSA